MIKNAGAIKLTMEGRNIVVALCGEIDHHNATIFRKEIDKLIYEKRPPQLILDLKEIDFMDSSGLGLIMGRCTLARELGGDLMIRNPGANILRICKLAGLERIIKIENNKNKEKGQANERK